MPVAGGYLDKSFVSNMDILQRLDARQVEAGVVKTWRDVDFMQFMKMYGAYIPTKVPSWYGYADEQMQKVGIIASATGTGTTNGTVTLTAGTSNYWEVGCVIEFPAAGGLQASVIGRTQAGGADTLTWRSESNIAITANDTILWRGYAHAEGGNPKEGLKYVLTPYGNKLQIIQHESPSFTDIQLMSDIVIENESTFSIQADADILKMKKAISTVLLAGKGSTATFSDPNSAFVDSDGFKLQKTSGFDEQVSAFGGASQVATSGVITAADRATREDMMLARKAPMSYKIVGSARATRPFTTNVYNLGSANVSSVRLTARGGDEVNFQLTRFISEAGFQYDITPLMDLSDTDLFPVGSSIGESLYYIPEGEVPMLNGGSSPYMQVRYMKQLTKDVPTQVGNVKWNDLIKETNWDGLAPYATNGSRRLRLMWTTYQGNDMKGVRHFFKQRVNF